MLSLTISGSAHELVQHGPHLFGGRHLGKCALTLGRSGRPRLIILRFAQGAVASGGSGAGRGEEARLEGVLVLFLTRSYSNPALATGKKYNCTYEKQTTPTRAAAAAAQSESCFSGLPDTQSEKKCKTMILIKGREENDNVKKSDYKPDLFAFFILSEN